MKRLVTLVFLCTSFLAISQNDFSEFKRIEQKMQSFKVDTSAVPEDKLTKEIRELRNLKGGFNINGAMQYKIAEERAKKEIPTQELDQLEAFYTSGNGKKWLDNAIIWIYRNQFTYSEIKALQKFYKSSAGVKMAENFPVIMIQSLKAAEVITEQFKKQK
jgi:hypothetical protein